MLKTYSITFTEIMAKTWAIKKTKGYYPWGKLPVVMLTMPLKVIQGK